MTQRRQLVALLTFFCLAAFTATAQPVAPAGKWRAEEIGGHRVIGGQVTLELADGKVMGSGGCNRYFGTASVEGGRVTFGQIASTRMACRPALMSQESKFLHALKIVQSWRIGDERKRLLLLDADGTVALRFTRIE